MGLHRTSAAALRPPALALTVTALTVSAVVGCGTVSFAPGGRPAGGVVGLGAPGPYVPGPPAASPASPGPGPGPLVGGPPPGAARGLPARAYLPHGRTVTVLAQRDLSAVGRIRLAAPVSRVVPSLDLRTLWAFGPTALVPLDPRTLRAGRPRPLSGARDLLFTPDGSTALVLTDGRMESRDPASMRLRSAVRLPCPPTAAAAFTADGERLVTACGSDLLFLDWRAGRSGSAALSDAPTRLLLAPAGERFYAATPSGVIVLDATTLRETARVSLGHRVTRLVPGRRGRVVYAAGPGSLSAVDAVSGIPDAAFPVQVPRRATLSALSPDGTVLWLREPGRLTVRAVGARRGHSAAVPSTDLTLHPQPDAHGVAARLR